MNVEVVIEGIGGVSAVMKAPRIAAVG